MKRLGVKMCCVIIAIIALACPNVDFAQDYNDVSSQDYSCVNGDSASVMIGGFIGQMLLKEIPLGLLTDDSVAIDKEVFIKGFKYGLSDSDTSLESYRIGVLVGYQLNQMLTWLEEGKGLKIDRKKLLESFKNNSEVYSEEKASEYSNYIQTHLPGLFGGGEVEAVYSDSVCVDTICYEVDSVAIDDYYYYIDTLAVEDSAVIVE